MDHKRRWVKTKVVILDDKQSELMGKEQLVFAPYVFDLDMVDSYRQATSPEGELEPYTIVFFNDMSMSCVKMEFDKFDKLMRPEHIKIL